MVVGLGATVGVGVRAACVAIGAGCAIALAVGPQALSKQASSGRVDRQVACIGAGFYVQPLPKSIRAALRLRERTGLLAFGKVGRAGSVAPGWPTALLAYR